MDVILNLPRNILYFWFCGVECLKLFVTANVGNPDQKTIYLKQIFDMQYSSRFFNQVNLNTRLQYIL